MPAPNEIPPPRNRRFRRPTTTGRLSRLSPLTPAVSNPCRVGSGFGRGPLLDRESADGLCAAGLFAGGFKDPPRGHYSIARAPTALRVGAVRGGFRGPSQGPLLKSASR